MADALAFVLAFLAYRAVVFTAVGVAIFLSGALYALAPDGEGTGARVALGFFGAAAEAVGQLASAMGGIAALWALGARWLAPYLAGLCALSVVRGAYRPRPADVNERAADIRPGQRVACLLGGLLGVGAALGVAVLTGIY